MTYVNIPRDAAEVPGFPGTFVTNVGVVFSARRKLAVLRKQTINHQGYRQVCCVTSSGKKRLTGVHRLVAMAFLPNTENLPCVHHRDHDKSNNSIQNLEWVTYSQNIKYNYSTGGQVGKTNMKGKFGALNVVSRPVICLDVSGIALAKFESAKQAAQILDLDFSHISKACRGKLKKHGGLKWRFDVHHADRCCLVS